MNWQIVVIAAICAVLLGGYSILTKQDEDIAAVTSSPEQPGFYMKNAEIIETAKDGKPRFTLHADSIVQDETHTHVQLQQVAVNYSGGTQTPWLLTAQQGHLEQDTRVITFNGDVVLQPQSANPTLPIVLTTDQLSVDTEHNLAHAPGRVNITMNQQRLTAVGLQANLQRQTIRLESQVHGEFASR